MANAIIGTVGPFNRATEQWSAYRERLEQFFAANDIPDTKYVPVLLSVIGSSTYELLRTLSSPARPADKSFYELCTLLNAHLSPKPIVIAERFRFHKRNQQAGEAVADFCIAIQKLAEYCDFGTNLSDSLRDRLVCGLASEAIQKKLLVEADLAYEKVKAIALAAETASRDAVELHKQPTQSSDVNKLRQKALHSDGHAHKQCCRCGKSNHSADVCFYKDKCC